MIFMVILYLCVMISREQIHQLEQNLSFFSAVVLLGARQVGKTTLCHQFAKTFKKESIYLDLELESHFTRLSNDAEAYLIRNSDKLIIIDEVQRMPSIFALLRSLIDMNPQPARFLLLGSSSPHLVKGVSESLAGRVSYMELGGINLSEAICSNISQDDHWLRGGFPIPLLASDEKKRIGWYKSLITSYIERDLNALFGSTFAPIVLRNYWRMLASNNGGLLNREQYARSLGITSPTVARYIQYMEGAYLINVLPPWSMNINKRLVKMQKTYIRDSGILHSLNGIATFDDLFGSIHSGASWVGYVIEQIRQLKDNSLDMFFYRTHQGAEVDLVLVKGAKPLACIEIKLSTSPEVGKGFYQCLEDLKTEKNFIIIPSGDAFPYKQGIWCYSLLEFLTDILPTLS
jgi:uncharacterized protein